MSDILQEVDEALKQDKMAKLWQDYGRYIIAALVLVVLMTAAKSAYEHYHRTTKPHLVNLSKHPKAAAKLSRS